MHKDNNNNQTAQSVSQNDDNNQEQERYICSRYSTHEWPVEPGDEMPEDYWSRDKAGNQLFTLGLKLSITTDWSGYDFPGPIPPEVASWVLANLPEEMLKP